MTAFLLILVFVLFGLYYDLSKRVDELEDNNDDGLIDPEDEL